MGMMLDEDPGGEADAVWIGLPTPVELDAAPLDVPAEERTADEPDPDREPEPDADAVPEP